MWSVIATWPFAVQAVQRAGEKLRAGTSALDAAEAGIWTVESDPAVTSVGRGGSLNAEGELETDAAVMDGATLRTGAVAALQGFEHPVSVARAVMEHTPHNILVGEGAAQFARRMGFAEADDLIPPEALERWEKEKETRSLTGHDTIGLLALDSRGHIAAATSTSGAGMKLAGRVGDSPLIGSGFYAEDGAGAAAATGFGEDIMRTCCSYRCVELLRSGMGAQEAAETVIRSAHAALTAHGLQPHNMALVCMRADGSVGAAANHEGFGYAFCHENGTAEYVEVSSSLPDSENRE